MTSIFESYWAAMFDELGWEYSRRPTVFSTWEPDFLLHLRHPVYVALVRPDEYPEAAQMWIDQSDCDYEVMIVTEDAPIPDPHGQDIKYGLGSARRLGFDGSWIWSAALIDREGSRVMLRHHVTDLKALTYSRSDEVKICNYLQTKWERAKERASGRKLITSYEELQQFEREKDFQKYIMEILNPDFHLYQKVRGKHFSGQTIKRIDLIIYPRDSTEWKDKGAAFGIEFKNPSQLRMIGDITDWLGQCQDYSNSFWEYQSADGQWIPAGHDGLIHVFACPALIGQLPGSEFVNRVTSSLFKRVMAKLGIGELKEMPDYGWCLVRNDAHIVWSQLRGVQDGRRDWYKRKFASR